MCYFKPWMRTSAVPRQHCCHPAELDQLWGWYVCRSAKSSSGVVAGLSEPLRCNNLNNGSALELKPCTDSSCTAPSLCLLQHVGVVSAAHLGGDGSTMGSTEHVLIKLLLMSPSGLKFLLLVFHSVKCFANQSKGRDMKS